MNGMPNSEFSWEWFTNNFFRGGGGSRPQLHPVILDGMYDGTKFANPREGRPPGQPQEDDDVPASPSAGGGFDLSSLGGMFGTSSGSKDGNNSLFDLLLGLGLSQQGMGDVQNNLFSGIEV